MSVAYCDTGKIIFKRERKMGNVETIYWTDYLNKMTYNRKLKFPGKCRGQWFQGWLTQQPSQPSKPRFFISLVWPLWAAWRCFRALTWGVCPWVSEGRQWLSILTSTMQVPGTHRCRLSLCGLLWRPVEKLNGFSSCPGLKPCPICLRFLGCQSTVA